MRSVRSTYWTMIVLLVVTIGIGALVTWLTGSHWNQASASDKASFDPTSNALVGLFFGQFVIVVLGAMTITAEYSTGMIRTSLTAMPRRGIFYVAKALVFTVTALVIGEVASFVAFFLGQALLGTAPVHISTTLGAPHVLRAVIGGGLFIAVCGLFAYGIGTASPAHGGRDQHRHRGAVRGPDHRELPAQLLEQRHSALAAVRGRGGHLADHPGRARMAGLG